MAGRVPLSTPPLRLDLFLEQACLDEEWERRSAAGVTYARGAHKGYDFQGDDRDEGRILFATNPGRVEIVDFGAALGVQTCLRTPGDTSAAFYAHQLKRLVRDGELVEEGEPIGIMGNTSSYNIGVHLHFETLERWWDWHSSYNPGARLRAMKEGIVKQLDRIEAKVDQLGKVARAQTAFLIDGANDETSGFVPDTATWKERGRFNLRALFTRLARLEDKVGG